MQGTGAPRTLVVTLPVPAGGLVTMTTQVVGLLRERGHRVGLAEPAPPWKPGRSRPAAPGEADGEPAAEEDPWASLDLVERHRIPARLPLVEWARYLPGGAWRRVLGAYDHHVVVTGSVLLSAPLVAHGVPHLSWVATGWWADRRDRFEAWPAWRKALDVLVNAGVGVAAERLVARHPRLTLAALSDYTASFFAGWRERPAVLPVGIETGRFRPAEGDDRPAGEAEDRPLRFGFASRLDDPRKNVGLLLEALRACAERGLDVRLHLAGPGAAGELREAAGRRGVSDRVELHGELDRGEMPAFYRALDVFAIPSRQEGLAIVGLEAMASGCPVVSTACGGPEEYVLPGETGYLVAASADAMADALEHLARDRSHRRELSRSAVRLVEERYSMRVVRGRFWELFDDAAGGSTT